MLKETLSYDFHGGVSISTADLEKYRKEVVEKLEKDKDRQFSSIRTGNSYTVAVRHEDGEIEVFQVSNGYIQYNYS